MRKLARDRGGAASFPASGAPDFLSRAFPKAPLRRLPPGDQPRKEQLVDA
jgi:hypothetical protein